MHVARKHETQDRAPEANGAAIPPATDPGLACLIFVAHFHGISADPHQLRHQLGIVEQTGRFSETDLLLASKSLGLKARGVDLNLERLAKTPLPALMLDRDQQHFILARVSDDGGALIQEGCASNPRVILQTEVMDRSAGRALLFASRASLAGDLMRFDFS